jgi:hypothetical protein
VDPIAGFVAEVKKKNSQPVPVLEPSITQPVVQRYATELSCVCVCVCVCVCEGGQSHHRPDDGDRDGP